MSVADSSLSISNGRNTTTLSDVEPKNIVKSVPSHLSLSLSQSHKKYSPKYSRTHSLSLPFYPKAMYLKRQKFSINFCFETLITLQKSRIYCHDKITFINWIANYFNLKNYQGNDLPRNKVHFSILRNFP